MKWVKQAFDHTVPTILRNFPWLIRGVHSLQTVLYQRNRLLRQKVDVILCNSAKATTESIVVLDAGCGDGEQMLKRFLVLRDFKTGRLGARFVKEIT